MFCPSISLKLVSPVSSKPFKGFVQLSYSTVCGYNPQSSFMQGINTIQLFVGIVHSPHPCGVFTLLLSVVICV